MRVSRTRRRPEGGATYHGISPSQRVLDDEHLSQARRVRFRGRACSLLRASSPKGEGGEASLLPGSTLERQELVSRSMARRHKGVGGEVGAFNAWVPEREEYVVVTSGRDRSARWRELMLHIHHTQTAALRSVGRLICQVLQCWCIDGRPNRWVFQHVCVVPPVVLAKGPCSPRAGVACSASGMPCPGPGSATPGPSQACMLPSHARSRGLQLTAYVKQTPTPGRRGRRP